MGNPEGAYTLGKLYLLGVHIDQDVELAEKWLLIAAKAGAPDAERLLGVEYASGERLERNLESAVLWLTPSAERGFADIQYKLATVYEDIESHKIGSRNYSYAYKWYYLANGSDKSMYAAIRVKAAAAIDVLTKKMTPDQYAEGRKLVQEWKRSDAP